MDNTIDHTFESANRVYDKNNLCPTIPTCAGGGIQPKIIEETKCCVAMRGRNPDNPSDRTRGAKMEQRLEMNKDGLVNTLTTVQKDNLVMEKEKINKVGQISNEGSQCGTVVSSEGLSPTLTAGTHGYANPHLLTQYRIRKLTPRECWRFMGYTDEDFEKAAFEKKELYIQGDNDKCNARLKAVQEKPKHTDMESFVSCIINDTKSMAILKIIKKLLAEMPENEKTQNVNFVITKSEELEHLECAINTTKCITFMGMQCTLTEGKDQLVMVITEQEKEDKQNTGKFMKIITELNSNPLKLYTILILTAQIIKSKIYGSTTLRANIQGNIAITDVCENSILLKISDLKMENTCIRVSSSQLYKQAGNAIVKQVLMAIFSQMNIKGVKPWNDMTLKEKNKSIQKSTSEKKSKNN